jgi:hypothetical protein
VSGLVLLAIFVGIVLAIYAGDRVYKAWARARKRVEMHGRLSAAVVRAEKQHQKRKAAERASGALTSVIPAIRQPPLSLPDMDATGAARRPTGGELPDQPGAGGSDDAGQAKRDGTTDAGRAESNGTADAEQASQTAGPRVTRSSSDTPAS